MNNSLLSGAIGLLMAVLVVAAAALLLMPVLRGLTTGTLSTTTEHCLIPMHTGLIILQDTFQYNLQLQSLV